MARIAWAVLNLKVGEEDGEKGDVYLYPRIRKPAVGVQQKGQGSQPKVWRASQGPAGRGKRVIGRGVREGGSGGFSRPSWRRTVNSIGL